MEEAFTQTLSTRPTVCLVANPGALAINLAELLLGNFCRVNIFTDNEILWKSYGRHLIDNKFLSIKQIKFNETKGDYLIIIAAYFGKLKPEENILGDEKNLDKILEKTKDFKKCLIILPLFLKQKDFLESGQAIQNMIEKNYSNTEFIFVSHLIGPRIILTERETTARIFYDLFKNKPIRLPKNEVELNILTPAEAARFIIKTLLSFGFPQGKLSLLGPKTNLTFLLGLLEKAIKNLKTTRENTIWEEGVFATDKKVYLQTDLEENIKETLVWFRQNKDLIYEEEVKTTLFKKLFNLKKKKSFTKPKESQVPKLRQSSKKPKLVYCFFAFLVFLSIVFLPQVLLFSSVAGFGLTKKEVEKGNFIKGEKGLYLAKTLAGASFNILNVYSKTPLVGRYYTGSLKYSYIFKKSAEAGIGLINVLKNSTQLVNQIFGDSTFLPSDFSQKLVLDLDNIYKETSFLSSEIEAIKSSGGFSRDFMKDWVEKLDLSEKRRLIMVSREIAKSLPDILGEKEKRVYLVLFQNNMELRPTGGFIGSFGLLKLEGARFVDLGIFDVYSADGQLKGYVEPPLPIKEHLGEASWYLRDSNWDPDFPTSAARAEWFLDKEMDLSFDGVVAIDLEIVKDLLGLVGELSLPDFERTVTKDNLYEVTQYEAEKDFFPGSRKKANFLASLSKSLMTQITQPEVLMDSRFAEIFYQGLNERNIQIFFHNKESQRAVADMGWDGAVSFPNCVKENCYADWVGVVDANLGVNKANYFIQRTHYFSVDSQGEEIKRKLTIVLTNTAKDVLGQSGKYKSYLRILLPVEVEVESVKILKGEEESFLEPDINELNARKEAGVLVEVSAGETAKVSFNWKSQNILDFSEEGEYSLYFRKQAGTIDDRIETRFFFAKGREIKAKDKPSLTAERSFGYNTLLSEDQLFRFFW